MKDSSLSNVNRVEFERFYYDEPAFNSYLKVYQFTSNDELLENGMKVKDLDSTINKWMKENKKDLTTFKEYFVQNRLIDKAVFMNWYGEDEKDRTCEWCQITKSEIDELIEGGEILTKRLSTRGRDMEVDRRFPNKGYEDGNLALCCYWCNNAKTDEFTAEEFIPIGKAIREAWKSRLAIAKRS